MTLLASETPVGAVTGVVRTAESGVALPRIEVRLIRGKETTAYSGLTDAEGRFNFRNVAVGRYTFMAKTKAHEQPRQSFVVEEGKTLALDFELKPTEPYLRVLQTQKVFTTKEEPKIRLMGFVPESHLAVRVFRVAPEIAERKWSGWLPESLTLNGQKIEDADLSSVPELKSVSSRDFPIKSRDIEGVFREEVPLGKRPAGMYLISLEANATRGMALITVTDLGLIVKAAPEETLAYAVNLETGEPMPGTTVNVYKQSEKDQTAALVSGRTDTQGLVSLKVPVLATQDTLAVIGRSGASMAVATYYSQDQSENPLRVYTYTERPIYRPGQTVYFKSTVRQLVGDDYRIPPAIQAGIRVSTLR